MKIGDCYKCGEPVQECTQWDISTKLGFTCEDCNQKRKNDHATYLENAKWLKEHKSKGEI